MGWFPCCRPCLGCIDGKAPDQIQVTLANMANGTCASCTSFNTSFVLDFDRIEYGTCIWKYGPVAHPCALGGYDAFTIELWITPGYDIYVYVTHCCCNCTSSEGESSFLSFAKLNDTPVDCLNLNNYSILLSADWTGALCDGSVATCLATAL